MKLLLTSGGITNNSIRNALVDLLGKPIAEANALCIPTAGHALPNAPARAWDGIGTWLELDWKSLGVLELTALPTVRPEHWRPQLEAADALLVSGGDPLYLYYWMRQSGVAALLPSLRQTVYVGLSAGSMIMAPNIGQEFVGWTPPSGGDKTLGVVDFAMFPHLDHEMLPDNTMANAEKWAAKVGVPAYAMDDQTAFKVVNGEVEVISEGQWQQLTP
jgi:dipeptidase E